MQKHLKKCFEGINELVFNDKTEIVGMISKEDEQVPFNQNIYPYEYKGNVEQWLLEVENEMKAAVKTIMTESISNFHVMGEQRTRWICNWQGQVVLTVSQIVWTKKIHDSITRTGVKGLKDYFKTLSN